jgi:hypothetical protein
MSILEITSILSAVTALLALSVSSIVTLRVTRRGTLSPLKHKWADDFRDAIAEYQGCATQLGIAFSLRRTSEEDQRQTVTLGSRFAFLERRLALLASLMLTPETEDFKKFLSAVSKVYKTVLARPSNADTVRKAQDDLTVLAVSILRKEYVALYRGRSLL